MQDNLKIKTHSKKKLVILGNCQGNALAKTLLENAGFSNYYEWDHIPPIQTLQKKDVPEVIKKVKKADLFIYQTIKEAPKRPVEFTSDYLLKNLKGNQHRFHFHQFISMDIFLIYIL
jgi:hypothetical protein